jgi:hypothetical protein
MKTHVIYGSVILIQFITIMVLSFNFMMLRAKHDALVKTISVPGATASKVIQAWKNRHD